ncbi:putative reverse transcriptase domain-containing protein, partial [Tanacetum coccineum]
DKNQVCLLCEVILKQIPAFNFFCASLESITAIEKLGKWEKVWEDIPTLYLGFVWAGKMEFGEVGSFGPSFLITNFARGCVAASEQVVHALGPRFEVEESYYAPARSTRGFRADYSFVSTLDAEIRRDPDREVGYEITDVWVDPTEAAEEIPPTTLVELSKRVTDFVTTVSQDAYEIYVRLDDAQSDRSLMTGQLNVLRRDRSYHANTALLVEREARIVVLHRQRIEDSDRLTQHIQNEHDRFREFQHTRDVAPEVLHQRMPTVLLRLDHLIGIEYPEAVGMMLWLSMKFKETITSMVMNAKVLEVVLQDLCALLIVFNISNYAVENQVKFATCTLHGVALTWLKSHVKTGGHDAAYGVPWNTLMKMMAAKYYLRNEIKKLEMEIWKLKVKGTDYASYTQRFQELALLCGRMFLELSDKIEKYVGGLPDMIHMSVMASKPKTMQDAIEFATELMDKKIRTYAERQAENKRKFEDTSMNNQNQQQQNKRQNIGRAYTAGPSEKREYGGSLPKCSKCNYHHNGPCAPKCHKCNKVGHLARDCRSSSNVNTS